MSVSLKLYIGVSLNGLTSEEPWFRVVARIDLDKIRRDSPLHELVSADYITEGCYFYAEDGNTPMDHDAYGRALRTYSVSDVLDALRRHVDTEDGYYFWSCLTAIDLLWSVQKYWVADRDRKPEVLLYWK